MITRISLRNVRLFADKDWNLHVPPLAIFCGVNSAGKSTILKSLLLLRQSQGIREGQGAEKGRLRFAGTQVDVGDYASLVSHNDTSREIGIGITIEANAPADWITFLQRHGGEGIVSQPEAPTGPYRQVRYSLSADFRFGGMLPRVTSDSAVERCRLTGTLKDAHFGIHTDTARLLFWKTQISSEREIDDKGECSYEVLIPEKYFKGIGGTRMMQVGVPNPHGDIRLSTVLRGLLPDAVVAKVHPAKGEKEQDMWGNWPMPPHIATSLGEFRTALSKLYYLGPLRSPAKRFYLTHLETLPTVDPTGESMPMILRERSEDLVWNSGFLPSDRPREVSLRAALNSWIRYFRTGLYESVADDSPEISLRVTSDVLVEIKIRTSAGTESHALTDSGFGFSQVLPILVRGLLAEPNSTLLVEQPELHLNPAMQVRLANFFVAMILAGKQVILETHSEHIVNAIRVLCAEDLSRVLHSKCGIFYLSIRDGAPDIREMSIRPDGMVPDWPRDFFGEAADLAGRLLRAQKLQLRR